MAGINGIAFIVVGVLVAIFSKFIQAKVNSPGLTLFFWAGILFIAYGVFKLVRGAIFKDVEIKPIGTDTMLSKFIKNKDLENVQAKSTPGNIVSCATCGTRHYKTSNFCHMCGRKLK